DLKILSSENSKTDLLGFMGDFLDKEMKNADYLEYHLDYQKELEEVAQQK
ncbi:hypothetical protein DBR06_SOUSAS40110001, partial [Sousa chinensis]